MQPHTCVAYPKKDTLSLQCICCPGYHQPVAAPTLLHTDEFLQDLAVVGITAGWVTVLFRQLRQPIVLGYIIAGVIIGAHTAVSLGSGCRNQPYSG